MLHGCYNRPFVETMVQSLNSYAHPECGLLCSALISAHRRLYWRSAREPCGRLLATTMRTCPPLHQSSIVALTEPKSTPGSDHGTQLVASCNSLVFSIVYDMRYLNPEHDLLYRRDFLSGPLAWGPTILKVIRSRDLHSTGSLPRGHNGFIKNTY